MTIKPARLIVHVTQSKTRLHSSTRTFNRPHHVCAPIPDNETERQRSLDELQILDTLEEQAYDDLTFIAAQICQTPIALVSLVDRGRQWAIWKNSVLFCSTPSA